MIMVAAALQELYKRWNAQPEHPFEWHFTDPLGDPEELDRREIGGRTKKIKQLNRQIWDEEDAFRNAAPDREQQHINDLRLLHHKKSINLKEQEIKRHEARLKELCR